MSRINTGNMMAPCFVIGESYAANGNFRISRISLTDDSSVRTLTPPFAG